VVELGELTGPGRPLAVPDRSCPPARGWWSARRTAADDIFIGRGEHVARRSLAFYQATGEHPALVGGRA
jgi:hypothetical protein